LDQRNALYASLRWELLFWLAICAAGYLGSYLTSKLIDTKAADTGKTTKTKKNLN
jgi:hypothetical protein